MLSQSLKSGLTRAQAFWQPVPASGAAVGRACARSFSSIPDQTSENQHQDVQQPPPEHPQQQAPPLPPPVMPAHDGHVHWLDRYFPGVRLWLQDKNRQWWIKGMVEARCKQYHQLEGREQELRSLVEKEYVAAMQRHAGAAVDERAETHLQVAALVLASHKVLMPYLRDEAEVLQIIREHMGGRTTPLLRFLLRATKLLHRDGYATLSSRLRGLQWDQGAGFESRLELGSQQSSLTITRCFYHSLFQDAGQPQLAAACCCTQDQVWFEVPYRGASAGRTAAISAGDPCCRFEVRRTPH